MAELSDQDLDRIVADVYARGGVSAHKLLRSRSEEERRRLTEALAQRGIERSEKHFRLDPVEQIARLVQREGIVKINRDTLVGVADATEKNRHVRRAIASGVVVEVHARPPLVKKGARGPFYAAPSDAVARRDLDAVFARFAALKDELAPFKRSKKLPAYRPNLVALRQAVREMEGALTESLGDAVLEATDEEVEAAFDVARVDEAPPAEAATAGEEAPLAEEAPVADGPTIEVAGDDPRRPALAPAPAPDVDDTPTIEIGEDLPPRPAPPAPAAPADEPVIEVGEDAPLPDAADVGAAVEDLFAPAPGATTDLAERLLAFVREQHDHGMLVVSTAELVRSFAAEAPASTVHAALFAARERGEVELRPETDLTALTTEEAQSCPRGDDGTVFTYVRSLR